VPKTGKSIEVSPAVFVFLKKITEMRIYGDQPGAVATFIIRKEVMHLVEMGVLKEAELLKALQSESVRQQLPEVEEDGPAES
jgi:hypothetical protein